MVVGTRRAQFHSHHWEARRLVSSLCPETSEMVPKLPCATERENELATTLPILQLFLYGSVNK